MCADLVVVGGGPIGCWTAIQKKKRNPDLKIVIYETRPEYIRDHMMSIRRSSLKTYAAHTGDPAEKNFYARIASAHNSAADPDPGAELKKVTYIRSLNFENILKDQCAALGIAFCYERIDSPEDAMRRHPECGTFFAADGRHSVIRKKLFGSDESCLNERAVFHSIDVTYEVEGQARYLKEPTYDKMDMIVIETIGREVNGKTKVGLRFLVDKEMYAKMPPATFKEPLCGMDVTRSPIWLSLGAYRRLRAQHTGEKIIQDTEKAVKIMLSRYACKSFATMVECDGRKAAWFLVGDSAMGMPFYRSVNGGLLLGSMLARLTASDRIGPETQVHLYNNAVRPFRLTSEFGRVALKTSGIDLYKNGIRPVFAGVAVLGLGILLSPFILGVGLYMKINPKARVM